MRRHRWWIGIGGSIIFLAIFFYRTDFTEIAAAAARADYRLAAPAVVAYFVGVWFRAIRWGVLLRPIRQFGSAPSTSRAARRDGWICPGIKPSSL